MDTTETKSSFLRRQTQRHGSCVLSQFVENIVFVLIQIPLGSDVFYRRHFHGNTGSRIHHTHAATTTVC